MPAYLIVAATKFEIQPLLDRCRIEVDDSEGLFSTNSFLDVRVLITGVGMVNTAFWMGKISEKKFDRIINAGICGSFNRKINIGEVVHVTEDTLSELGAQNDTGFLKYEDLKLGGKNFYHNPLDFPKTIHELKKVCSITVNTVHGNEHAINNTIQRYSPDVESMEGAAFFRGCENIHNSYYQIRAVSNYVEKRDRSKWDLPLAIKNLNDFLIRFIEEQE
jgi:futalosine hydrolase